MIIMMHELSFQIGDRRFHSESSLVLKGTDSKRTAMAKTVGLPLGIAARAILNGSLNLPGVHIPVSKVVYEPLLTGLSKEGINFEHQTRTEN